MTAGAIAVPTVVPLRLPTAGNTKKKIDSNTLIDIHSDTPDTRIYYTVDNTRPDPDKKLSENTTILYKAPFMLRQGKRYIKALARSRDGRESNVVTKVFNVEYAEPVTSSDSDIDDLDDSENFQQELNRHSRPESKHRTASVLSGTRFGRSSEAWIDMPPSDLRISSNFMMRPQSSYSRRDSLLDKDFGTAKFIPPDHMDSRNLDHSGQINLPPFSSPPMWKSEPVRTLPQAPQNPRVIYASKPRSSDVQTQTVGLFYPGGKKVVQEQEMLQAMRSQELKMRDKQPALTAVSPGRGFWRRQLDHICGHLRGYTNNNVEFRSAIGDPKLGKILSTTIDEGEEELILSMTFALKGHTEYGDGGPHGLQRDLYQGKKKYAFGSTFGNEENESEKQGKKSKKKGKKKLIKEEKMNPEDRLLIKELGPSGEGKPEEVKQLLKEGANPNCLNSERRSALSLAVMQDRMECVKVLLKGGADVNRRSGLHHNTPLHQAVKLGPDGKDMVKLLLKFGAKSDLKNERGASAYDLAVRSDYNSILALFNEPTDEKKRKPRYARKKKEPVHSDDSESDDDSV